MFNTLKGYINKLDEFSGAGRGRTIIESSEITGKKLEIAIQTGKATANQWEQISQAMKYSKENNIDFKLQFLR